ncbi:MAG: ComEA family DNA-binding protein [Labilithrix sp.]|nr:ComEA family DNA-binding protein [Labilithrix sp.]MCW5815916.1 ComEA family DNA-binding protein [Labilithrix sp.]
MATSLDAGVAPVLASAPVPAPPPPPPAEPPSTPVLTPPPPSSARATPDDPVYVNYASAEQLRRLPGVGPKRAEAIVALRARMGRFQRIEDLLRVKGIGRSTIKKWRPLLRLDMPYVDGGAP